MHVLEHRFVSITTSLLLHPDRVFMKNVPLPFAQSLKWPVHLPWALRTTADEVLLVGIHSKPSDDGHDITSLENLLCSNGFTRLRDLSQFIVPSGLTCSVTAKHHRRVEHGHQGLGFRVCSP